MFLEVAGNLLSDFMRYMVWCGLLLKNVMFPTYFRTETETKHLGINNGIDTATFMQNI